MDQREQRIIQCDKASCRKTCTTLYRVGNALLCLDDASAHFNGKVSKLLAVAVGGKDVGTALRAIKAERIRIAESVKVV